MATTQVSRTILVPCVRTQLCSNNKKKYKKSKYSATCHRKGRMLVASPSIGVSISDCVHFFFPSLLACLSVPSLRFWYSSNAVLCGKGKRVTWGRERVVSKNKTKPLCTVASVGKGAYQSNRVLHSAVCDGKVVHDDYRNYVIASSRCTWLPCAVCRRLQSHDGVRIW